jgi:Zn finger protein HypA/HybF involved in hydrogenase expression
MIIIGKTVDGEVRVDTSKPHTLCDRCGFFVLTSKMLQASTGHKICPQCLDDFKRVAPKSWCEVIQFNLEAKQNG